MEYKIYKNNMRAKVYEHGQPEELFDAQIAKAIFAYCDTAQKCLNGEKQNYWMINSTNKIFINCMKSVEFIELPPVFIEQRLAAFQKSGILTRDRDMKEHGLSSYRIPADKIETLKKFSTKLDNAEEQSNKFMELFNKTYCENIKEAKSISREELTSIIKDIFYKDKKMFDDMDTEYKDIKTVLTAIDTSLCDHFHKMVYCSIFIDAIQDPLDTRIMEGQNFCLDGVILLDLCGFSGYAQAIATDALLKAMYRKKIRLWIHDEHLEEFQNNIEGIKNKLKTYSPDAQNIITKKDETVNFLYFEQWSVDDVENIKNQYLHRIINAPFYNKKSDTYELKKSYKEDWYIYKYEDKKDSNKSKIANVEESIKDIRSAFFQNSVSIAPPNWDAINLDLRVSKDIMLRELNRNDKPFVLLTPNTPLVKYANRKEIQSWKDYQIKFFFTDLDSKIDSQTKMNFLTEALSYRTTYDTKKIELTLMQVYNEAMSLKKQGLSDDDVLLQFTDTKIQKYLDKPVEPSGLFKDNQMGDDQKGFLIEAIFIEHNKSNAIEAIKEKTRQHLSAYSQLSEQNKAMSEVIQEDLSKDIERLEKKNEKLSTTLKNEHKLHSKYERYLKRFSIKMTIILSTLISVGTLILEQFHVTIKHFIEMESIDLYGIPFSINLVLYAIIFILSVLVCGILWIMRKCWALQLSKKDKLINEITEEIKANQASINFKKGKLEALM